MTKIGPYVIILKLFGVPYRGVEQLEARRAHNPEVVGSSPASATIKITPSIRMVLFLYLRRQNGCFALRVMRPASATHWVGSPRASGRSVQTYCKAYDAARPKWGGDDHMRQIFWEIPAY